MTNLNQFPLQRVIAICFVFLGGAIALSYCWTGYATLTGRAGLWGSLYSYYQIGHRTFYLLCFLVAAWYLVLTCLLVNNLVRGKKEKRSLLLWIFSISLFLLIGAQLYLETRFIGKG